MKKGKKEGMKKDETKFEGKKKEKEEKEGKEEKKMKKEEKEEKKEKNMDTNKVKCAQVSLCGAMRVVQKEVGSPKVWSGCVESESMVANMVAKLLLVVMMAVFMYMFSVAEKNLKNMILDNATWQDWCLSGRWQDWCLSRTDRDRRPSRKGLSKANSFRKRRHVKRRLALVGQLLKIMVFIGMDTVHAMQHGPEANPDVSANGPAGSAQAPNADQVLAQVLRQNTEALKFAISCSVREGPSKASRSSILRDHESDDEDVEKFDLASALSKASRSFFPTDWFPSTQLLAKLQKLLLKAREARKNQDHPFIADSIRPWSLGFLCGWDMANRQLLEMLWSSSGGEPRALTLRGS